MSDSPELGVDGGWQRFGLSPQQRRLLDAAESGLRPVQCAVRIEGSLQTDRLRIALAKLVERHEVLRSVLDLGSATDGPSQMVLPDLPTPLSVYSASSSQGREGHSPFKNDLVRLEGLDKPEGPLTATLTRQANDSHVLVLSGSPLFLDAPSLWLIVDEIIHQYDLGDRRSRVDRDAASEEDPVQHGDVAEWHNELRESTEGSAGREFWRSRSWPDRCATSLPFEEPIRSPDPHVRDCVDVELTIRTIAGLERLAKASEAEPRTVLLACYLGVLWRFTNRSDVIIGRLYDGRGLDALEGAVGPYTQALPVPTPVSADHSLAALVGKLRDAEAEVREWEQFFDWNVVPSALRHSTNRGSLPFTFDFHSLPASRRVAGLTFEVFDQDAGGPYQKLLLSATRRPRGMRLRAYYDSQRLKKDHAVRVTEGVRWMLSDAIDHPDRPIGTLDVIGPEERERLVLRPNDTRTEYPRDALMHEFMARHADLHPDRVAVEFEGASLTYAELNERAERLGGYLRREGVGPDTLVAVFAEASLEMVIAIFGVLKAGAGYVPLSPSYPPESLAFMLDDVKAGLLLTVTSLEDRLPQHPARVVRLDRDWPLIEAAQQRCPRRPASPDHLAYVIYTSGSTGSPKGVIVTHRTLVVSNEARIGFYGNRVDRFMLLSPFAFDSSAVGIFWTLSVGGTLCVLSEERKRDVAGICREVDRLRSSHLLTLPSFYSLILQHGEAEKLKSLATVIVAGEACPKAMVELHRRSLPGTGIYSEYGATETTIWSSAYDCLEQTTETAPLGHPIANCQMYLLDEGLEAVPVGVPGEVHFGGEILAKGYWNRPQLTAEKFIANPFDDLPGARLYKSGDLARYLADGEMEFQGRIDNQVKIRGFRVELEEIEIALASHPMIDEAAVALVDTASDGPGSALDDDSPASKRLVAYVCPLRHPGPPAASLREHARERLPVYMVPSAFITLERLPRTPNGKVDRSALPDPPATATEPDAREDSAPRSAAEMALAEIWSRLLGVDRVGRHDNFFELGGDSILSIQAVARARRQGLSIGPQDVFARQTVAELAQAVSRLSEVEARQEALTGEVPLHPIQHWFFEQQRPEPHHANMSQLVEVEERLDPVRMEAALLLLLEHHDALRMVFERSNGAWRQRYGDLPEVDVFSQVDLSEVSSQQLAAELESRALKAQSSFDLERGPLLRVVYFDLGPDVPGRLLFVAHHLVFDGVSLRILLEDFVEAYGRLSGGKEVRLPLKTSSYRSWVEHLEEYAGSSKLHEELHFWLEMAPDGGWELPMDFPSEPSSNRFDSQRVVVRELGLEQTRDLLHEIPRTSGSKVDEVLLTSLVQALADWTGQPHTYVELEGHGREPLFENVDVSRTIGWFTTVFPVLLEVDSGSGPADGLRAITKRIRSIPNHGIGFGLLRYLSDGSASKRLSSLPVPHVNFNYLGQFDQTFTETSLFEPACESTGAEYSGLARRPHVLEVVSMVINGRFRIQFFYSATVHCEETIERLADGLVSHLDRLMTHGLSHAAGSQAAADFDEFSWDEGDLDRIASAIEAARRQQSHAD